MARPVPIPVDFTTPTAQQQPPSPTLAGRFTSYHSTSTTNLPSPPSSPRSHASSPVFGSPSPSPSPTLSSPHSPSLQAHGHSEGPQGDLAGKRKRRQVDSDWAGASELKGVRRTHMTTGYREGVSAGRNAAGVVQAGFDEGYVGGAEVGMRVGVVLESLSLLSGLRKRSRTLVRDDDGQTGEGKDGLADLSDETGAEDTVERATAELNVKAWLEHLRDARYLERVEAEDGETEDEPDDPGKVKDVVESQNGEVILWSVPKHILDEWAPLRKWEQYLRTMSAEVGVDLVGSQQSIAPH